MGMHQGSAITCGGGSGKRLHTYDFTHILITCFAQLIREDYFL